MKIAVISTPVFPCPPRGYAGLEMVAYHQAEGLAKLGHEVTLFAPDESRCHYATLRPFGPAGRINEQQAYGSYHQELQNFDVITDHSWAKFSYLAKMEGRVKAPVLGVMHAPINTMYQTLPPLEKPCIVCLSSDQKTHFEALFERDCRVAHNGVDFDFYKKIDGVPRTDRFLFLARFSKIKGPLLAIQACRDTGASLDLVGDTSITNEPDYFNECVQLCDGRQIKMVGPATRGECVSWFSSALCMLHPTKEFREPFGLAPIEAMACGCPVIAWNRGAVKDTILHGETGWLVKSEKELRDRIAHVRENGITDGMRSRCVEWAKTFSLERMAKAYETLCKEAVETGGW